MTAPVATDIDVIQGQTFEMQVTWADETTDPSTPISLDGYVAHMQMRPKQSYFGTALLNLTSYASDHSLHLEPNGETGVVTIRISAQSTALLSRSCYYDLFLIKDDDVTQATRLLFGKVNLFKSVTVNSGIPTDGGGDSGGGDVDTTQIEAELAQHAQDIDTLQTSVSTQGGTLSSLGGTVAGHTTALSGLGGRLTAVEEEAGDTASALATLQGVVDGLGGGGGTPVDLAGLIDGTFFSTDPAAWIETIDGDATIYSVNFSAFASVTVQVPTLSSPRLLFIDNNSDSVITITDPNVTTTQYQFMDRIVIPSNSTAVCVVGNPNGVTSSASYRAGLLDLHQIQQLASGLVVGATITSADQFNGLIEVALTQSGTRFVNLTYGPASGDDTADVHVTVDYDSIAGEMPEAIVQLLLANKSTHAMVLDVQSTDSNIAGTYTIAAGETHVFLAYSAFFHTSYEIAAPSSGGGGQTSGPDILSGPGFYAPAGSLDRWRAARDNASNELAEVVVFGDSTTSGLGGDQSWVYTVRQLAIADGYADGGRGIAAFNDGMVPQSGENLCSVRERTGFSGFSSAYDPLPMESLASDAGGEFVVLQGYGTKCRLTYGTSNQSGDFSVTVDDGDPVVFTPGRSTPTTNQKPTVIDLGADGLHTVRVDNLGGRQLVPGNFVSGGGLSYDGTAVTPFVNGRYYYYGYTAVTAEGESTLGRLDGQVSKDENRPNTGFGVSAAQRVAGAISYNIYRTDDSHVGLEGWYPDSEYQLVGNAPDPGGFGPYWSWTDLNDSTPGQNPPAVGTAGRGGPAHVTVVPDFFRETGLVWHKNAVSGSAMYSFFGVAASNPANQIWSGYVALGLTTGGDDIPVFTDGVSPDSNPAGDADYRKPALSILALGINDQQGVMTMPEADRPANLEQAVRNVIDGVGQFARCCAAVGSDALVVIPHLEYSYGRGVYAMQMRTAIASAAHAMGCAVVDFNVALGPVNVGMALYTGGPHLNQAGYDVEAEFIWTNVLKV